MRYRQGKVAELSGDRVGHFVEAELRRGKGSRSEGNEHAKFPWILQVRELLGRFDWDVEWVERALTRRIGPLA